MAILERISQFTLAFQLKTGKEKKQVKIFDFLDPKFVIFLDEKNRDDALLKLVQILSKSGKLKDKKTFYEAILEREKIVSTGIGMGVAIPHAKLDTYDDFFIVIGVQKKNGIDWNSLDRSLVRLIFMIGGPENQQARYLQILSKITSVIKNAKLKKDILQQDSAKEILQLLKDY